MTANPKGRRVRIANSDGYYSRYAGELGLMLYRYKQGASGYATVRLDSIERNKSIPFNLLEYLEPLRII